MLARAGEVHAALSMREKASLGGYKALPSPLTCKLLVVVLW